MSKIYYLLLVFLTALSAISCKDDPEPVQEFLLNENQSNWTKRILIQRPLSNVAQALAGEYCEVHSGILFQNGDTVAAYASLRMNTPVTYIFRSTDAGRTWNMQGSENGFILSAVQDGQKSFALREYLNNVEFGTGMQYGGSWTWQNLAGNANQIRIIGLDTLLVFGDDGIRVSENGGASWSIKCALAATDIQLYNDSSLIGIFGHDIKVSLDMGSTWSTLYTATQTLNFLYRNSQGDWFCGGSSGCLLKSTNQGVSWSQKFILTQLYSTASAARTQNVLFIDNLNGFAVIDSPSEINCGDDFDAMTGCILRTINGGETWQINYRTEFIRYNLLQDASGPNIMALGAQYRDNYVSGIYVTLTTTLGN